VLGRDPLSKDFRETGPKPHASPSRVFSCFSELALLLPHPPESSPSPAHTSDRRVSARSLQRRQLGSAPRTRGATTPGSGYAADRSAGTARNTKARARTGPAATVTAAGDISRGTRTGSRRGEAEKEADGGGSWACGACTFVNKVRMAQHPRSGSLLSADKIPLTAPSSVPVRSLVSTRTALTSGTSLHALSTRSLLRCEEFPAGRCG